MADDNLLAALTGLTEGFSSVYVPYTLEQEKQKSELRRKLDYLKLAEPYQRSQAEFESSLRSKEKEQEFNLNNYLNYSDVPENIAPVLGMKKGERIRKEFVAPSLKYLESDNKIKRMYPQGYFRYAGSEPDIASKALSSARIRLATYGRTIEGQIATENDLNDKLEEYFQEDLKRLKGNYKGNDEKKKTIKDSIFEGLK